MSYSKRMSNDNTIRVGVGLLLLRGNKILLGKRKGSHGAGEYAAIGGHVEYMESFEEAVMRELAEECGANVQIKNLRQICLINLRSYTPKHYIDIGFTAEWAAGKPQVMEPHKLVTWEWFDIDSLPSPIFAVDPLYIKALRTGKTYFDCP